VNAAALDADLDRRVRAAQAVLRSRDLPLLIAVCAGAPREHGWLRYLTNAETWGGRAFVTLRPDAPDCRIVIQSTYDEDWIRAQHARATVESTLLRRATPIDRVVEEAEAITAGTGRVGILRMDSLTPAEHAAWERALPRVELVDLGPEMTRVRRVKAPFEIDALRRTGRIVADGLERFAGSARPGGHIADLVGDLEGYLKGRGCFWGGVTCALDGRASPAPAPQGRALAGGDVVTLHVRCSGPYGYWHVRAATYAFAAMSAPDQGLARAAEAAMRRACEAAVPGATPSAIRAAVEVVARAEGASVDAFACRSIGTDEVDDDPESDDPLTEDTVVGIRVTTSLDDAHAVALADSVRVADGSGVSLSPLPSFYRRVNI
jgi:Xaa-Pro aminopeptidase